jgi:hypothetical protein
MAALFRVIRGLDASAHNCFCVDGDGVAIRTRFTKHDVTRDLQSFDRCVRRHVEFACLNKNRDEAGDEPPLDVRPYAKRFRRLVLGEHSLGAHCPFKESILFDIDNYCAALPLELMHDQYQGCPNGCWSEALPDHADVQRCPRGCPHPVIHASLPLGLLKQVGVLPGLTHASTAHPERTANKALVFGLPYSDDPRMNLAALQHEHLKAHMKEIADTLRENYYEVKPPFIGRYATQEVLLEALADPAYGVFYIYAHGQITAGPKAVNRMEYILTADGDRVSELNLPSKLGGSPFVFLNCCSAGKERWSETRGAAQSLAHRLLDRGAAGVVAPMCKVVTTQAAQAAREFFALAVGTTLGRALGNMRKRSYVRYDKDKKPDLSWFAYRLYGDPDACLPTRVWTSEGTLVDSAFTRDAAILLKSAQDDLEKSGEEKTTARRMLDRLAACLANLPGTLPVGTAQVINSATQRARWPKRSGPDLEKDYAAAAAGTSSHAKRSAFQGADPAWEKVLKQWATRAAARNLMAVGLDLKQPLQLDIADVLDAFPLEFVYSGSGAKPARQIPGERWPGDMPRQIRDEADRRITDGMSELSRLNSRYSSGAAFLVQQIEHKSRSCLTIAELRSMVRDLFLAHFLVGTTILRGQSEEISRLRERLVASQLGLGPEVVREIVERCVADLLDVAKGPPERESKVTEQSLYIAFGTVDLQWAKHEAELEAELAAKSKAALEEFLRSKPCQ